MKLNVYRQAERFAVLTKKMMELGKTERVSKCLMQADLLLVAGNPQVKNAISNVFLISLSNFLETHYEVGRKMIQLFPEHLRLEYNRQIYSSAL